MPDIYTLSEEDIKHQFITPQLHNKGREFEHISMEQKVQPVKITDGNIYLQGNIYLRAKPKFADYILYL